MPDATLPGWPRALAVDLAAAYVGLSRTTWLRLVAERAAPSPVMLTPGRRAWLREDLDAWLDDRRGRDAGPEMMQHDEDIRALAARLAAPQGRARRRAAAG